MAFRRFNWKLVIVLVLALAVLGITVVGLRSWNRTHRASMGQQKGKEAFDAGQWEAAANHYGQYLSVHRTDTVALKRYAQAHLNIRPVKKNSIDQAVNAYRLLLRLEADAESAKNLIEIYLLLNVPAEGEDTANKFLAQKSDSDVRRLLALCLAQQRKYDQAIAELMRLIQQDPSQLLAYDILAKIVQLKSDSSASGQEALAWFDKAIQNNPQSSMAYVLRANFHLRENRTVEATADLERAQQCPMPEDSEKLMLAAALVRAGQLDKAWQILEQVRQKKPDNVALWPVMAHYALVQGTPETMASIAQHGLEALGQENFDFLPLATELYIRAQHYDQARQSIEQMRKVQAGEGVLVFLEGLLAERTNDWPTAAEKYRRSMELGRSGEDISLKLAFALAQMRDWIAAVQVVERQLSVDNTSVRAHLMAGQWLAEQKQWERALEHANQAIAANPNSISGYLLQFQIRFQRQMVSQVNSDSWEDIIRDALAFLEKTENKELRLLLARSAMQTEQLLQAAEWLAPAVRQYPSDPTVVLAQAELLLAEDKIPAAIELLETHLAQLPHAGLVRSLAFLLVQQKDYSRAESVLLQFAGKETNPSEKLDLQLWIVEVQMVSGRQEQAVEMLKKLAADYPKDIRVRRKLIELTLQKETPDTLQAWIDQIKQIEGDNGRQWRYEQAMLWFARYERGTYYPQIVSLLNETLKSNPEDNESRMLLAAAHEAGGNRQLAVKTYLDAMSRNADDLNVAVAAIGALYRANEYSQADQILTDLLSKGYKDPRLGRLELQSFMQQGKLAPASDVIEKQLQASPGNRNLEMAMALIKIRQKEFDSAGRQIDAILSKEPDFLPAIAAKVQLYIAAEQKPQAIELCDQTVARLNTAESYLMRCQLNLMLDRKPQILADIDAYRSKAGTQNVQTYLVCSQLYTVCDQPDRALQEIQPALKIANDDLDAQKAIAFTLGIIAEKAGKSEDQKLIPQIKEILDTLWKKNQHNEQAAFTMAMLLHNQGKEEQAAVMYEKTLALEPRQAVAINNLAWITCRTRNNPQKALELANQGLQIKPDYADLIDTRGLIYFTMGDYGRAMNDFNRCIQLYSAGSPAATASSFRLAKTLAKLGKINQAIEQFNMVKQMNQQNGGLAKAEIDEMDAILKQLIR